MKLIRNYRDSVGKQLILMFVAFTVAIVVIITVFANYYISQSERNLSLEHATISAEQIGMKVNILMDEAAKVLEWSDETHARAFLTASGDRYEETKALIADMNLYRSSALIDQAMENVYLFTTDGTAYDEKRGIYPTYTVVKSSTIKATVAKSPEKMVYLPEEEKIVLGTIIRQILTNKVIGYAAIEFKDDVFDSFLSTEIADNSGPCLITDMKGKILIGENELYSSISSQKEMEFDEDKSYCIVKDPDGKDTLIIYQALPYTDWYLTACVHVSDLNGGLRRFRYTLITIAIVTILISLFLYSAFAARITYPITRLKEKMLEAAEGDLNVKISDYSTNEFGILEQQFNRMMEDFRDMIRTHNEDQTYLQKAEFKALQAQIAPHFLYNTFDTIIWLVAVGENDKAIEMIENLSIFFKTALSKGMDWISAEKEVEHVRSYLYIQQSRYNDILTYHIYIDSALLHYDMLKMTLQPIVENAIYHGIKNKENGGSVTINGFLEDETYMIFDIIDTGVGMEETDVTKLNKLMRENKQGYSNEGYGFGLYNVNRRIRLYYNDSACGLYIYSTLDKGTTVRMRLRRQEGKLENV